MRKSARWALLAVTLASAWVGAAWAQPVPGRDPVAGSRVFDAKGCAKCHAVNGVGGKIGPDLTRVSRPHSYFDLAAAMWNHLPRMAERMKQLGIDRPKLDETEMGDLLAFLYTLNYFDPPGDRAKGRKLFAEKGCIACHQRGGTGGTDGPSLDVLKAFTSPLYVSAALWNHGPQMAEAMKAKGIARPTLTGQELRDLIAYLAPATAALSATPVFGLPGRPEAGRMLFVEKKCVECHSAAGAGGKVGPDLVDLGVRRSPVEFAAAMWNKAPAMTTAMQQRGITVPDLRPEEMADIVAYLYTVKYFAAGSISAGWRVIAEKGCLQCHSVFGERGKTASDLTKLKGLDSSTALLAALWNHTLVTPTLSGTKAAWPVFRPREMADLIALLQSLERKEGPPAK